MIAPTSVKHAFEIGRARSFDLHRQLAWSFETLFFFKENRQSKPLSRFIRICMRIVQHDDYILVPKVPIPTHRICDPYVNFMSVALIWSFFFCVSCGETQRFLLLVATSFHRWRYSDRSECFCFFLNHAESDGFVARKFENEKHAHSVNESTIQVFFLKKQENAVCYFFSFLFWFVRDRNQTCKK